MTFSYFGYGSNMLTERLQARCKSAVPIGIAAILGYELEFSKLSNDGSGKAAIVRSSEAGARVLGVLFKIALSERDALDRAEGAGYKRDSKTVQPLAGGKVCAATYIATERDADLQPYDWYHALVIAGARQHKLAPEWIARLEQIPSKPDPNASRPTRVEAIAALQKTGFDWLLSR